MDYYIQWECPNCDETNYFGLCRTYLEHKGLPCVSLGEGEQQTLGECTSCGQTAYTGELEVMSE